MTDTTPHPRVFLFLQGPHGPFFHHLGRMLRQTGAQVWRVGFNAGDRAFWPDRASYIPCTGTLADWPAALDGLIAEKAVTDIVLYGDTRPVHAAAAAAARARGLCLHVFEEGYLRPYWVTYERGGSNGHSRLMDMPVADMQRACAEADAEAPLPPAHWGDMRQHIFYGALYHAFVLLANRRYRGMTHHRALPVAAEFRLYLNRLLRMPWHALDRRLSTRRIRCGGYPYHLALLQLEHDSAFVAHSPFASTTDFVRLVLEGFSTGALPHHHLVFKAHPLEDGRVPLRRMIREIARQMGVAGRVHFVPGGKLAALLDDARTAVTVNSTAGQQALWRGLPLKVFGRAVYAKPEFVSDQPLAEFFRSPTRPDTRAYRAFRRFLLETSQVAGGFYASRARHQLLRQVVDLMLAELDPYDALCAGTAARRQQLRQVV